MNLPDLEVGGIVLAPIITALVEVAKVLGLSSEYAPWLNGLLSVIGYGLMILVLKVPGSLEAVTYVLNALVIFLMAAGFYTTIKFFKQKATGQR